MNQTTIAIPEASYYSLDSAGTTGSLFVTSNTSLYVTTSSSIDYGSIDYDNGDDGDSSDSKYIKRKRSAIRTAKKKKGSTIDANNKRLRIKNLVKPIVVFKFLKENFKPIERRVLNSRLERISQILESTAITNQIALKEKIEEKFAKLIREQEMFSCGFDKFFERSILQAFVDSVKEKAIKITPIKNYIRLIPKKVREKMDIAREKNLFDDYVVIHCDPENKAIEKTQEEKKDPILCGVIKQSSRYYLIGDWQDELCDLTMDTILDHLGLEEDDVTFPDNVEASLLEILNGD